MLIWRLLAILCTDTLGLVYHDLPVQTILMKLQPFSQCPPPYFLQGNIVCCQGRIFLNIHLVSICFKFSDFLRYFYY